MLSPGTQLQNGKYEIIRTLGQGGFGITYLARETDLKREEVIKAYHDEGQAKAAAGASRFGDSALSGFVEGSPSHQARIDSLLKEARLLSQVNHPHFVTIYGFFKESGKAYIAMEYVPGKTLKEALRAKPSWQTRVKWIIQVAQALEAIHAKGIIHRDLKPANILIRDEREEAVLIDMGIAMYVDADGNSRFLAAGTPGYAAPEQFNPDLGKAPAVDVYGLGATLYHCLQGTPPPDHVVVANKGLPALPPGLPEDLAQVVGRALALKQEDRYPTIEAFRKELEAILDPVVEPLPDPKPKPEAAPPAPRRSYGWLIIAGLLAIVLGGGLWWRAEGRKEKPETPISDTTPFDISVIPDPDPLPPLPSPSEVEWGRFSQDILDHRLPLDARQAQLGEALRTVFATEAVVVTASVVGNDTIVTEVKPVRAFFEGLMVVDGVTLQSLQTELDQAGRISVWTVQVNVPAP